MPGKLTYGLVVEGLGEYTGVIDSGRAEVIEGLNGDHRLQPRPPTNGLAAMAAAPARCG